MPIISSLIGREILDSKADPVVEVELTLEGGITAVDSVPSGASTGDAEAAEIRDLDLNHYSGKGVLQAVANVNNIIKSAVIGKDFSNQVEFDDLLLSLDKTPHKSVLGANAILPVSLSFARASAAAKNLPLYRYFGDWEPQLPRPMILLIEGGKHGEWATDIQEFMILPQPQAFSSFSDTMQAGVKIFKSLGGILESKHYSTGVGFEGAFCPGEISSNEEAFDLILQAISHAGFSSPGQFVLAIDFAASEFYQNNNYVLKSEANQVYSPEAWAEKILYWTQKYPLYSLEDPFDQTQWTDWSNLASKLSSDHQVVGDDLLVTDVTKIQKAIDQKACNSVIIKPNQIGTLSETLAAIILARENGFNTIISHRGGETCDSFIADLAVGTASPECKFGGPNRGERLAKYNRLLTIEYQL